jgi:hypothetical protein
MTDSGKSETQLLSEARAAVDALRQQLHFLTYRVRQTDALTADPTPASTEAVRDVLRLLRPFAARGMEKIRIGRDRDGGYVVLDDFTPVRAALSFGVGDDASFDLAMAERGLKIAQIDHSIAAPPAQHPNLAFFRTKLGVEIGDGAFPLSAFVEQLIPAADGDVILKLDIEGDEWRVLETAEPALLKRFRQIVCEFHRFDLLAREVFRARADTIFRKLEQDFFVVHVHANNYASTHTLANVVVPEVLEITFVNRQYYQPEETAEIFPGPLDRPNRPAVADIQLGSFRF